MQPFFEAFKAHQTIELASLGISTRILLPAAATGGSLALFEETTAPARAHRCTSTRPRPSSSASWRAPTSS